jgi:hypothetical protein
METKEEKIRKLIDKSELSLLADQVWQQHKTILFLEERVTAFERIVAGYQKVTMDLAKELRVGVGLKGFKNPNGKYNKSFEEVRKRWLEWKRLEEEEGFSPVQIATRWGVDRGTVEYAKAKGYIAVRCKKKSDIPASILGHKFVSLPPTRKVRKQSEPQLRLAA